MFKSSFASLLVGIVLANSNKDDTTGIFGNEDQWISGLVTLPEHKKDDMFYWLFQSRANPDTDPLVIWLTGGPGCASEIATFFENGPLKFREGSTSIDSDTFDNNPYSWNKQANLLYVDQPIGTGFSNAGIGHDVTNEDEIARNMVDFLTGFLDQNPSFIDRDMYITGESYAGHYIPAIGYHILKEQSDLRLSLKGIAIGNGLVDPYIQYPQYSVFAYENGLIGKKKKVALDLGYKVCQDMINIVPVEMVSMEYCQLLTDIIIGNPMNPHFNVYDIREQCDVPPLCYDFSQADNFLNDATVQEVLGVSGRKWKECSMVVHSYLLGDWMTNLGPKVSAILDDDRNVDVLVYSGDKDFICNWRGGEAWTLDIDWSGKQAFNDTEYKTWNVNGQAAGDLREYSNLRFLRVFEAGHMVPMDQPEVAQLMLDTFITKKISGEFKLDDSQPTIFISN